MTDIERAFETLRAYRDGHVGPGLPEDLFLFASTLVPMCNVDLVLQNEKGQYLLAWRDDTFFGKGWHLPGSCILYKESFEERIQACALSELGARVIPEKEPLAVRYSFQEASRPGLSDPRERGHQISLLYRCVLPPDYVIDNGSLGEDEQGYLRWFDSFPENTLPQQESIYHDFFERWRGNAL